MTSDRSRFCYLYMVIDLDLCQGKSSCEWGIMGCFRAFIGTTGSPDVSFRVPWDGSDRLMTSSELLDPILAEKYPKIDLILPHFS